MEAGASAVVEGADDALELLQMFLGAVECVELQPEAGVAIEPTAQIRVVRCRHGEQHAHASRSRPSLRSARSLRTIVPGARGSPVLNAMSPSTDPVDLSVIPDEWAGARLAVEHLLDGGGWR
ncbi:hypothetical protein ACU635_36395 [[Actinomadura] parvosata]|uniref:hypothetical protein n=1 Tax=[Actinomadura] parvosata TaxID=1955412 RepID=UPI00406C1CA3